MICVSSASIMLGQGVVTPILPLFADELGISTVAVGLTLSVFAFARVLLNIPVGILCDQYGCRLALVGGPVVTTVGMVGSGFAEGLSPLLFWRFLAGAGSAMYAMGAQVYLAEIAPPESRARFVSMNHGALLIGVSVGPALGGLTAEGLGLRAPFFIVGAIAGLTSVYAWFGLPEMQERSTMLAASHDASEKGTQSREAGREEKEASPGESGAWRHLLFSRDFFAVCLVGFTLFGTRAGSRNTLMPLIGDEEFGLTVGSIGLLFAVLSLLGFLFLLPSAAVSDNHGRKWAIVPGMSSLVVGVAVMAFAPGAALFVAGSLLLGIGAGMAGPVVATCVVDIAPAELRGVAIGMYRTVSDMGNVLGPIVLGFLADSMSVRTAMAVNALGAAFIVLWFALMSRETRPWSY